MSIQSTNSTNSELPGQLVRRQSLSRTDSKKQDYVVISYAHEKSISGQHLTISFFGTTSNPRLASCAQEIDEFVTEYYKSLKQPQLEFLSTYQLNDLDPHLVNVRNIAEARLLKKYALKTVTFNASSKARIIETATEFELSVTIPTRTTCRSELTSKTKECFYLAESEISLRKIMAKLRIETVPFVPLTDRRFSDLPQPFTLEQFIEIVEQTLIRICFQTVKAENSKEAKTDSIPKYPTIVGKKYSKSGANFIVYLLQTILQDKNLPTKTDKIRDMLIEMMVSSNKRTESLSNKTFDYLTSNGTVPIDLFNAPEFKEYRRQFNAKEWAAKQKHRFTFIELEENALIEFKDVIETLFKENDLQALIDVISSSLQDKSSSTDTSQSTSSVSK